MRDLVSYGLIFLLFLNFIAFFAMSLDKEKARLGKRRISEKALFGLALLGGSFGIYLGMFTFRHKTKKWYFVIGIPIIIIGQLYLLNRAIQ